jgi:hypothetical protein
MPAIAAVGAVACEVDARSAAARLALATRDDDTRVDALRRAPDAAELPDVAGIRRHAGRPSDTGVGAHADVRGAVHDDAALRREAALEATVPGHYVSRNAAKRVGPGSACLCRHEGAGRGDDDERRSQTGSTGLAGGYARKNRWGLHTCTVPLGSRHLSSSSRLNANPS